MYEFLLTTQPPCRLRAKLNLFGVFVCVVWLSSVIYYMLAQLLHTKATRHRQSGDHGLPSPGVIDPEIQEALARLGFVENPDLYDKNRHKEPAFAAFVQENQIEELNEFLVNFKLHFKDKTLVLYNIDIPKEQARLIERSCQCVWRAVPWDEYPPLTRDLRIRAYRPIIIQETLREFGVVFWCNPSVRFITSDLSHYVTAATTTGLLSWNETLLPTSALSHHKMFSRLGAKGTDYLFHRMAEPDLTLYVNTARLHSHVMAPWVRCALDTDCISPIGSQPGGCNFLRKPRYLYAGCHHYDVSAFNIVLGAAFDLETSYLCSQRPFVISR